MADTKVSALTAATATSGADVVPLVQSSTSKKISVADLHHGGYATTATAAGTTTLTVDSAAQQFFTGTTTQTVTLPNATTLQNGHQFHIDNDSTGVVTVNYNGGSLALSMAGLTNALFTLTDNGTSAGTWDIHYFNGAPNLGIATMEQCIVLASDYTLTSSTTEQKLFNSSTNGRLTVPTGRYLFECGLYITTMSATSGNAAFDILGAGSATMGTTLYNINGIDNSTPTSGGTTTGSVSAAAQSAASMVTADTGTGLRAHLQGIFTVTAAGTIVPSITLVTANAAVVKAGSYFTCRRVMADSQSYVGNWD